MKRRMFQTGGGAKRQCGEQALNERRFNILMSDMHINGVDLGRLARYAALLSGHSVSLNQDFVNARWPGLLVAVVTKMCDVAGNFRSRVGLGGGGSPITQTKKTYLRRVVGGVALKHLGRYLHISQFLRSSFQGNEQALSFWQRIYNVAPAVESEHREACCAI